MKIVSPWCSYVRSLHVHSDPTLIDSQVKDVLDAVRVKDERKVVIKRMATGSEEHKIIAHLSSGSQLSDPRNRTVPVLDIITHTRDSSISFVVMPFARRFSHPPFHCRAEFAKAIRQYIEVSPFR
jgi:hypothetical protein